MGEAVSEYIESLRQRLTAAKVALEADLQRIDSLLAILDDPAPAAISASWSGAARHEPVVAEPEALFVPDEDEDEDEGDDSGEDALAELKASIKRTIDKQGPLNLMNLARHVDAAPDEDEFTTALAELEEEKGILLSGGVYMLPLGSATPSFS